MWGIKTLPIGRMRILNNNGTMVLEPVYLFTKKGWVNETNTNQNRHVAYCLYGDHGSNIVECSAQTDDG